MRNLINKFRGATLRGALNSTLGLVYALRHSQLQGMTNQMRSKQLNGIMAGALFLGLSIVERSSAGIVGSVAQIAIPTARLAKAGRDTMLSRHDDIGGAIASRACAFMIAGTLALGSPAIDEMGTRSVNQASFNPHPITLSLSEKQVPQPLKGPSLS